MKSPDPRRLPQPVRIAIFVVALYLFLLSISLLGDAFKGLGAGFARTLISLTASPISGVFVGILATSILQSSSCTTSLVVGLVASGTLGMQNAISVIMGANIGTTVTGLLVSFMHVTRRQEFARAFPAAVVHDSFNLLTVLILLPAEMLFHPLAHISARLAGLFTGAGGLSFASPLKLATAPVAALVDRFIGNHPVVLLVLALVLLFVSLKFMVDMMRSLVGRRMGLIVDKYLFGSAVRAFLLGLLFTAVVQSSSATISIVVPMAGAGLLTVRQIFPYAVGANIGTTVTAMLAAFVTGSPAAVQLALAHLSFNVLGAAIWSPLRALPIWFAEWWGRFCARHRVWALVYVGVLFFVIPLAVTILTRK